MTQITFLHGALDRLQAVAAWLAQAGREGKQVLVYVPATERSEHLDRLLWTHSATGFTPHCRAGDKLAAETPIILASDLDHPLHDECLLNLSDEVPPGFSRFQQLIEIVSAENDDKLPGRERFRFYRERGYPLEANDISGGI
ncbi:DNA polymerase III subunit chi [Sulfuritalea hydrogenivorans]|jgi:DNA polymerase-3 subunit chi|uniref:DNA polymerase III subunit chi HolC n=1 Tax=Sulfuritalea hydrogenivorans sk43H TaxID=1223802 RepID=W0SIR0_9PROT|nr:DNA polymerase III subunit chi [Sulfuritalea hydrogenivorans]MDK9714109.1 DNA polymerase III subunit chi [Sulfuritalea sp.]BAO30491.1 DNA polymerase III subunit chi HolC [Sulfuritalea hydrogenivorans sk43H]